ncbi:MAG: hypothetical protein IH855_07290 [Bacteroidetes bacterium]|nr:hypothetical protein [Bacteroidota bacterium]
MNESEGFVEVLTRPKRAGSEYVQSVLSSPGQVHHYADGFTLHGRPTDVVIVLERAEVPGGTVTMTYPVVKSLIDRLEKLLKWYEEGTGVTIQSKDEIMSALAQSVEATQTAIEEASEGVVDE